jgi:hypothetical protein
MSYRRDPHSEYNAQRKFPKAEGESPFKMMALSSAVPSGDLSLPGGIINIPPKVELSADIMVLCTYIGVVRDHHQPH